MLLSSALSYALIAVLAAACVWCVPAEAQMRGKGASIRSVRGPTASIGNLGGRAISSRSFSRPAPSRFSRPSAPSFGGRSAFGGGPRFPSGGGFDRARGGSDTPILDALRSGANARGGSDTPILDALRGSAAGNGRGYSDTPILDRLVDAYDQDQYGNYGREDEFADAYRDVGIANAVVSVVGILADTAVRAEQYRYQQYGGAYGAPGYGAPGGYAAPPAQYGQPSGHWEDRAVAVSPARYVQEQVYVPPIHDPTNGRLVGGGYYETRSRYVPEQVEYQKVWVPYR